MKVLVDFCLLPLGTEKSMMRYIVECQKVLETEGFSYQTHALGTLIEGEWEDVFDVVQKCHHAVHQLGAPKITTTLKVNTHHES